jgi:uncharacterized pyridoxamine 5'-phosphate oxidase family protein
MDKILKLLNNDAQKIGVISTLGENGQPQSAAVYYTFDDKLNIYFVTRANSRKYKNAILNKKGAFAIVNQDLSMTLQIEGALDIASKIEEQEALFPKLVMIVTEKNAIPPVSKMDSSEMIFMKLTPTWARIGDFSGGKDNMFEEVNFN